VSASIRRPGLNAKSIRITISALVRRLILFPRWIGCQADVRGDQSLIRFYVRGELIKTHERKPPAVAILRRHDIRQLQSQLALLGLSSLGRTESPVSTAVQTVHRPLNALPGTNGSLPFPEEPALEMWEGIDLLEANTNSVLGPAVHRI
jgi:hypothetical protein